MDGIGIDVLIFIGLAVVSLVSSLVKKSRNAAQKQQHETRDASPVPEEDPWESIRRMFDSSGMPIDTDPQEDEYNDSIGGAEYSTTNENPYYGRPVEKYAPVAEVSMGNNASQMDYSWQDGVDSGRRALSKAISVTKIRDSYDLEPKPDNSNMAEENDRWNDVVFDEFNIRNAILYSEILKPKFED